MKIFIMYHLLLRTHFGFPSAYGEVEEDMVEGWWCSTYPCNLKKVRNAIIKRGGTFPHMKTDRACFKCLRIKIRTC